MIEVLTTLPIQVDGEAWPQPPGVISLKRLPEQVRVTTTAIYIFFCKLTCAFANRYTHFGDKKKKEKKKIVNNTNSNYMRVVY